MDENEIAKMVEAAMEVVIHSPYAEDWNYPKAAQETAHAIAERMKAGVVWETTGTLEHADRDWFGLPGCRRGLTRVCAGRRKGDDFNMIGHLEFWGIHAEEWGGQRVHVTVRLEGEDGQTDDMGR